MFDNKAQLLKVVQRYLSGKATPAERKFLESYYDFFRHEENVLDELIAEEKRLLGEQIQANIMAGIQSQAVNNIRLLWSPMLKIAAAAAILIFCTVGIYTVLHQETKQHQQIAQEQAAPDIAPGGNQAILTLSNGRQIRLNNKQSGQVASQAGKAVMISGNGQLSYTNGRGPGWQPAELVYNTLTTPLGNHRNMTLADGTEVSLDAGSSITYPVVFDKKERSVSITGQVYFKVRHNAAWPFNVKVKATTIQDIGTEFNINAYDDEPQVKTTLIAGSVKVNTVNQQALLEPGEQASTSANQGEIKVATVDTEPVIAWKDGLFIFKDEDFKAAMRQVSRWYNVTVIYDPSAPADFIPGGWVSRAKNISEVLKIMELTGNVHFKVEGRRITVTK
jgi:transmembrane sensor